MKPLVSGSLILAFALASLGAVCSPEAPNKATSLDSLPSTVSQSVLEGGPNPAALPVNISNAGSCALAYTLAASTTDGKPWLAVSPASGTVTPGGQATVNVSFDIVGPALGPGTYTGSLLASGTCATTGVAAAHSPRNIAVNLTVAANGATLDLGATAIGQDLGTLTDRWTQLSVDGEPSRASTFATVSTGRELLMVQVTPTGLARYNIAADEWTATAGCTSLTDDSIRPVWTGTQLYALQYPTFCAYDRASDAWAVLHPTGTPRQRYAHSSTWTGSELLTWGGWTPSGHLNTGDRYTPGSLGDGAWSAMSAPPAGFQGRTGHTATWTGRELLIWGGGDSTTDLLDDSAINAYGNGARYAPATDTWAPMSNTNAPTARYRHTAVWTGARLIVWGGRIPGASQAPTATGAIYLPAQNEWRPMAASPLSARYGHSAVWTGSRMIVWGGLGTPATASAPPELGDGAAYDPVADTWTPLSSVGAPTARYGHAAFWVGFGMIVLGGKDSITPGANPRSLHVYR